MGCCDSKGQAEPSAAVAEQHLAAPGSFDNTLASLAHTSAVDPFRSSPSSPSDSDAQWSKSHNTQDRGDIEEVRRAVAVNGNLDKLDTGYGWQCDWNLVMWASANGAKLRQFCTWGIHSNTLFSSASGAGYVDAVQELITAECKVNVCSVRCCFCCVDFFRRLSF